MQVLHKADKILKLNNWREQKNIKLGRSRSYQKYAISKQRHKSSDVFLGLDTYYSIYFPKMYDIRARLIEKIEKRAKMDLI